MTSSNLPEPVVSALALPPRSTIGSFTTSGYPHGVHFPYGMEDADVANVVGIDTPNLIVVAGPMRNSSIRNVRHVTDKVGRNDLCRCASGKKYKKCCGS
jgi:hypothetical protein